MPPFPSLQCVTHLVLAMRAPGDEASGKPICRLTPSRNFCRRHWLSGGWQDARTAQLPAAGCWPCLVPGTWLGWWCSLSGKYDMYHFYFRGFAGIFFVARHTAVLSAYPGGWVSKTPRDRKIEGAFSVLKPRPVLAAPCLSCPTPDSECWAEPLN